MSHDETSSLSKVYSSQFLAISRLLKTCGVLLFLALILIGVDLYSRRNLILGFNSPIRKINALDICEAGMIDLARKDLKSPYLSNKLIDSIKDQDFELEKFLLRAISVKESTCKAFIKSNNQLMFFHVEMIPDKGLFPFKLNLVKQISYKEIDEYTYLN